MMVSGAARVSVVVLGEGDAECVGHLIPSGVVQEVMDVPEAEKRKHENVQKWHEQPE